MDMTGTHRIEAPRERVWDALNDPEILRQCIPGCEEVQKLSDTEFTAKVTAKVGPVSAKFTGKVALSDLDPPNGYTISGEGSGGVAGFGKGGATVRLEPDGTGTLLSYVVEAKVGGKLAQIGSRLVDATARKMADDFFSRFSALVGDPAANEAGVGAVAEAALAGAPGHRPGGDLPGSPSAPPAAEGGTSAAGGAAATARPTMVTPPEVPLPMPVGSRSYLPWAAAAAVVALVVIFMIA